jgi:hypothetical protein
LRVTQLFNDLTGFNQLTVSISLLLPKHFVLLIQLSDFFFENLVLLGEGGDLLRASFLSVGHFLQVGISFFEHVILLDQLFVLEGEAFNLLG